MACSHPENNYLAIDLVDPMLGLAKRKIEEVYGEHHKEINNVLLTRFDIERILLILNKKDAVDGIYINFCNPWPRGKHHKKRLTYTRQLEHYKEFLKSGGNIYFKTDDDELFRSSLDYFEEEGFEIVDKTLDLQNEDIFRGNIETEHEKMFKEQGINMEDEQLRNGLGYDHNWVLKRTEAKVRLIASLYEPQSGRLMEVYTDQPGLQFYSGNFFNGEVKGKYGETIKYREALALETQKFPDSPNHVNFPSTYLSPEEKYTHTCIYKFSVKK